MDDVGFKTCIDCINKEESSNKEEGTYYCPVVRYVLPNGTVYYDTDATDCIRNGNFKSR